MNNDALNNLILLAQSENVLPNDAKAQSTSTNQRPWPVIVLTALGAWLVAIPAIIVLAYIFSAGFHSSAAFGFVGVALIVACYFFLNTKELPIFIEQFIFPLLITGLAFFGWMLLESFKLPINIAAPIMSLLLIVLALVLPQFWLRTLLGAGAGFFAAASLISHWEGYRHHFLNMSPSISMHFIAAAWVAIILFTFKKNKSALWSQKAIVIEPIISGWLVITLLGLALVSGQTFLLGASLSETNDLAEWATQDANSSALSNNAVILQAISSCLTLCAGVFLGWRWISVRKIWFAAIVISLAALAFFMPTLGVVLLILCLCCCTQRWLLAGLAATSATWIVGAFYYALTYPLIQKAGLLALVSIVLAGFALWGLQNASKTPQTSKHTDFLKNSINLQTWRSQTVGVVLAVILVGIVANTSIWQKEKLIKTGQPVFVALAPVDPRSLMQGDFMALNFIPRSVSNATSKNTSEAVFDLEFNYPSIIFQLDEQGIASLVG